MPCNKEIRIPLLMHYKLQILHLHIYLSLNIQNNEFIPICWHHSLPPPLFSSSNTQISDASLMSSANNQIRRQLNFFSFVKLHEITVLIVAKRTSHILRKQNWRLKFTWRARPHSKKRKQRRLSWIETCYEWAEVLPVPLRSGILLKPPKVLKVVYIRAINLTITIRRKTR